MPPRSPFGARFARRIARSAVAATAAIAYLITPVGSGGGTAHAADQTLTVSTSTGNQLVLGQPIRITVAAKSDTLISGTIIVSADSSTPTQYDVEVPAGTTKELTILGLPLQYPQEGYSITWIDDQGKRVASTNLRSSLRSGDTVVGVFPSLGTDFPERIDQPTDTTSFLFTIPEQQLQLPAVAFAQYDVIIASLADVEALDGDLLLAFQRWLATGGRLVLDDGDQAQISDLLGMAEPSDRYGRGRIELTAGTLRPDGWEHASLPVPARSSADIGPLAWIGGGGGTIGMQSLPQGLVKYSGDPLIGSLWLLLLVFAYAVIVGPLMFVALRRRRRSLWVVGPVIALVACSLIWLESARRRDTIQDAHGTVIQVDEVASSAISAEMLYVRSDDPVGITLPPTYGLGFSYDDWTAERVVVGDDGTRVSQTASVGSFVVYNGFGPAQQFDNQLTGTMTIDGDEVYGEITNRLDVDLHQVAVMWDRKAKNIGDVPAGATVEYKLTKKDRVVEMMGITVWGDSFIDADWWGMTQPKPSGQPRPELVSTAVWDSAATADPTLGVSQSVDIVGWTDQLDSPITGSSNGVSAVMTRVRSELAATEGESELVYAAESPNAMTWSAASLVRLDAPTTDGDLALNLSKAWGSPQLLIDGEWVELTPEGSASIIIPADVLDKDGGIYLKSELNLDRVQSGTLDLPRLHEPTADEKTVTLADALSGATDDQAAGDDATGDQTTGTREDDGEVSDDPLVTVPPTLITPGETATVVIESGGS